MTWRQILESLKSVEPEVLDQTAIVYLATTDEYVEIIEVDKTIETDVFDDGQYIIVADF